MDNGYYHNYRREVLDIVPKGACRILEIGCAAGCFRLNFGDGVEYWGVEPVEDAAEEARTRGIKVFAGTYDSVCGQLPDEYFDVVVCNDVIEHMPNPDEFLVSVKGKLAPGGVLVGSVPNVRFWGNMVNLLIRRDWKYEDSGVLDKTHLRFFTRKSLKRLLESAGYRMELLRGIESMRMKVLKVLFAPILILAGFDICDMQFVIKGTAIRKLK
ncbi:MAG: class I SAM-dependent methyltransferase [Kiritimatiellae bacterium]|nr:class I SAM-dependent methyltransferase [Kiritimatiellia bacterium]